MRFMHGPARCVFGFLAVFWLAACEKPLEELTCTDAIGCVRINVGDPIHIGVLQATTGRVATLGTEQLRGFALALDDWNGTLLGHPVKFRQDDTGCTAEGGANAALKIIADPEVVAILGTTCSAAAATASKAMSDAGLTMVSGNNSAPYLTSIGGQRAPHWQAGYFRTAGNEQSAGYAAAMYAYHQLGVRRAATVHDGDIYTRGLVDGFEKALQHFGGRIVLSASVNKGERQMGPLAEAVINAKAELLFFPLFQPEGNLIVYQARALPAFKDIHLMSDGALIDATFLKAVGQNGRGMLFVGPAKPSGLRVAAMAKQYIAKFDTAPGAFYYLNAYDAAHLLLSAIRAVAIQAPDGRMIIGRQALRDALYATSGMKGVAGTLNCDKFGDCAEPKFNVLRFDDPAAGLAGLEANVVFSFSPGPGDQP